MIGVVLVTVLLWKLSGQYNLRAGAILLTIFIASCYSVSLSTAMQSSVI